MPACLETEPWGTSLLGDGSRSPALCQEENHPACELTVTALVAHRAPGSKDRGESAPPPPA